MKKLPASALVTVDAYIAAHPSELQKRMKQIRNLIRKAAPKAEESISYMMPAYKLHGPLVYFGQQKNHLGFYVMPSGVEAFRDMLAPYQLAKSAIQFPNDEPLPAKLITDIVKFRVAENTLKVSAKKKSPKV
jgi:uncharacterized protein YdhG (YjbR/CyaY superfamily)